MTFLLWYACISDDSKEIVSTGRESEYQIVDSSLEIKDKINSERRQIRLFSRNDHSPIKPILFDRKIDWNSPKKKKINILDSRRKDVSLAVTEN